MQQINFYQLEFQPKQISFPAKNILIVSILVLALVALFSLYFSHKIEQQTSVISKQQLRLDTSQNQLAALQQQLKSSAMSPLLIAEYDALVEKLNTEKATNVFLASQHLGNHQGYTGLLEALSSQSINGVWLVSFSLIDSTQKLELQGRTINPELIPAYIESLAKSDRFQGQQFSVFEIKKPSDDVNYYQFKLRTEASDKVN